MSARRQIPILVGREREQISLREELSAAIAGQGGFVLLGGEAGIGKTSLARNLAREAQSRGALVLTGNCYDRTNTPPYGPWLDLLTGYQPHGDLPAPPSPVAGGVLDHVTDQAALFAAFRQFLAELSAARPTVVVLEDLHWTDAASVELLRHLAPFLHRWPLLALVTYRVDELTRGHPLYQQLPALVREAEGLRLDLKRLDLPALQALVAARYDLSQANESRLTSYLAQHAEGNPFFAIELLRAVEEDGLLALEDGQWALRAIDRVVVPSLVRQVVDERIARLGEETRQLLAIAAVIGQEAPLTLWSRLAPLDEDALLTIIERAAAAHVLEATQDGASVRFVHALTREALYESVLAPRRRLWHRQVADALMADDRPDPDSVAYHLQQAGDPRAWEWLERAGERAQRAYAWSIAVDRLTAAASLLQDVVGAEQKRGQLLYRIARLQRFYDPVSALASVDEAGRLAAQIGDEVLAAEVSYHRGVMLFYFDRGRAGIAEVSAGIAALVAMPLEVTRAFALTEPWLADALHRTALNDTRDDDITAALLHEAGLHYRCCALPWFFALSGRLHDAIASGEQFVAILTSTPGSWLGSRSSAAFVYFGLAIAYAALGRPDDARQTFTRARTLYEGVDHHLLIAFTLLTELHDVALTFGATDPGRRRQLAAEATAALGRTGGVLRPGVSPRLAWLTCSIVDGRWAEADQILADVPDLGNMILRREVTWARCTLGRHRGQPEAAWAEIRALLPDGPATEPGDLTHQEGLWLQRLAAELCLDAGDLAGAAAWLAAHDAWLAWSDGVLGQSVGHLAWARVHRAGGDHGLARTCASAALTSESVPDQPLVRLAAHRLLGEISAADGTLPEAEQHLLAALNLSEICEAPFERARTLLPLAELRAAQGSSEAAMTLLAEARDIGQRLGAAPLLARLDAAATRLSARPATAVYPAGLTQREVEVLRMLAQRQTDREIADLLFLTHRTVQSHVTHILTKLGVANRREAAVEAARLGLL